MYDSPRMFKRILVGYDLSEQSRRALALAGGLARAFTSQLTVLHVVPMPPVLRRWSTAESARDLERYEVLLRRQLANAQQDLERRAFRAVAAPIGDLRCVVRAGAVPDVLVEVADRIDADLIVVGRGKRGVLGPTPERVVRLAGRAVLVAPVKGRSFAGALLTDDPERDRRGRSRSAAARARGARRTSRVR